MLLSTLLAFGCLPASMSLAARPATCEVFPQELEVGIDALMADWDREDSPGAAIAVMQAGEIMFSKGYGMAQLEYDIPVEPTTIFHVASISKQFTAMAVLLAAEQGLLELDGDLRSYLPEVPDFGSVISLRHLLLHTSGLRDQWEGLAIAGWRLDDVITKQHVLDFVRRQRELNFPPGSQYLYCNTGYTLAAEAVARVSGMSFRDFCQQNIFEPLGMTHTHFHDDHEQIVPNRAYSYARNGEGFRKSVLSYANVGATSLFTTPEDLLTWMHNFEQPRIGIPETLEAMQTPGKLSDGSSITYALGLSTGSYRECRYIGHGGSDAGFRSQVIQFPEHELAIAVTSNLAGFSPSTIAYRIADILLPEPPSVEAESFDESDSSANAESQAEVAESEPLQVDEAKLDRLVGEYVAGNLSMTFRRSGKQLYGRATGQPEVALQAENELRFRVPQVGATVEFHLDNQPLAQRVTIDAGGMKVEGARKGSEADRAPDLQAYLGRYFSPELETIYEMVVEDGQLIARHFRHGDIPLQSLGRDQFRSERWFFRVLEFQRSADEESVTGFLLSSGRVKKLRFVRWSH